jgi:hypothetical protein
MLVKLMLVVEPKIISIVHCWEHLKLCALLPDGLNEICMTVCSLDGLNCMSSLMISDNMIILMVLYWVGINGQRNVCRYNMHLWS